MMGGVEYLLDDVRLPHSAEFGGLFDDLAVLSFGAVDSASRVDTHEAGERAAAHADCSRIHHLCASTRAPANAVKPPVDGRARHAAPRRCVNEEDGQVVDINI